MRREKMGNKCLIKSAEGLLLIGTFCLAFLSFDHLLLAQSKSSASRILLPPPPVKVLPPSGDIEETDEEHPLDRSIREKREERAEREEKLNPPPPDPSEKRDQKLMEETFKPRNLKYFMDMMVVYPHVLTKGNRKNYQLEPTVHTKFFLRHSLDIPIDKWQLWYGARFAAFSGSGIYNGVPGRFGFFYFGPMLAFGKIESMETLRVKSISDQPKAANSEDQRKAGSRLVEDEEEEKTSDDGFPSRDGWFVAGGVAAQNRVGYPANSEKTVDDDLNTKSIAFDSPGVWIEANYVRIYFGALSFNVSLGAQAGKGKTFLWLGLGGAGWY